MCSTSLGCAVVPEVKYSSSGSSAAGGAVRARTRRRGVRASRVRAASRSTGSPTRDARVVARDVGELRGVARRARRRAGRSPRSIRSRRSAGPSSVDGRDDHRAELDRGEHRLPQLHLVAEHQHQPVAAPHALAAQPVGHRGWSAPPARRTSAAVAAVRPRRSSSAGRSGARRRDHVEPVQRPVELRRAAASANSRYAALVVVAVRQQEVARRAERRRRVRHAGEPDPGRATPSTGVTVNRWVTSPHTLPACEDGDVTVLEHAFIHVDPERVPDFVATFPEARAPSSRRRRASRWAELHHGVERPGVLLLLVGWESSWTPIPRGGAGRRAVRRRGAARPSWKPGDDARVFLRGNVATKSGTRLGSTWMNACSSTVTSPSSQAGTM